MTRADRVREAAAALELVRLRRGEWVTDVELRGVGIRRPGEALGLVKSLGRSLDARELELRETAYSRAWRLPSNQLEIAL